MPFIVTHPLGVEEKRPWGYGVREWAKRNLLFWDWSKKLSFYLQSELQIMFEQLELGLGPITLLVFSYLHSKGFKNSHSSSLPATWPSASLPSLALSTILQRIDCMARFPQHPFPLHPRHPPSLVAPRGPAGLGPPSLGGREPITQALGKGYGGGSGGALLPSASGTREWGEPPGNPCVPQRLCTESRWGLHSSDSRCWCAPLRAPHTWAGPTSFLVWEEVGGSICQLPLGRAERGNQHCKPRLVPAPPRPYARRLPGSLSGAQSPPQIQFPYWFSSSVLTN